MERIELGWARLDDETKKRLSKLGIRGLGRTPGKLITAKGPIDGHLSAFGTVWGKLKMTGDVAERAVGFRPKEGAIGVLLSRRRYVDANGKVKKGIFASSLMPYPPSSTRMGKLNNDRIRVLGKIASKHMNDLIYPIWEPLVKNKSRKPWSGYHYFISVNAHRVKLTTTRPGPIKGSLDWSKLLISNGKLLPPKRMYPACYDTQKNLLHITLPKTVNPQPFPVIATPTCRGKQSIGIGLLDIITGDFLHIPPDQISNHLSSFISHLSSVPPLQLTWKLNQITKHFHLPHYRFKCFSRFYIYIYYKKQSSTHPSSFIPHNSEYSPSICSRVRHGNHKKKEKPGLHIIIFVKYPWFVG